MRGVFLSILLLFSFSFAAFAGDDDPVPGSVWKHGFSLEVGTGFMPLHMALLNQNLDYSLADKGQEYSLTDGSWHPAFSISFNWRPRKQTEFSFAAGLSWFHHGVVQFSVFGTDPAGKLRYDLDEGRDVGMKNSLFTPTLTVQFRHIWTPDRAVQWYSGCGLGLVPLYQDSSSSAIVPLPAFTPIGMRYGGRHFYFFLEHTYSPAASLLHGGLGWRL